MQKGAPSGAPFFLAGHHRVNIALVRTLPLCLALAGCLGEATFTPGADLSASVVDLAGPANVDQGGGDGPKGYTCKQLNDCEKACAADPKPQMCIMTCRSMATMAAIQKEAALQACFGQNCPQATDAGTSAICTPTDGGFTMGCTTCIANSQVSPANMCTDLDGGTASVECHQCYDEALACVNDM
jgi:hypothetical protein